MKIDQLKNKTTQTRQKEEKYEDRPTEEQNNTDTAERRKIERHRHGRKKKNMKIDQLKNKTTQTRQKERHLKQEDRQTDRYWCLVHSM